jgi:peptidoglycan/xylan/chitin deacetylase (PgdA/CDA1 family)
MNLSNLYYYLLKPVMPRSLQVFFRRRIALYKRARNKSCWPIDQNSCKLPEGWPGWPEKKQFALVLTHDVEKKKGVEKCYQIIELEKKLGFRSSFNFVAEGYTVPSDLRLYLTDNGFEVGLHGVIHDPKVFSSKGRFLQQVDKINYYLKEWGAVGFRAPCMYHYLDWYHALNIEYDASTFDTDPFEPQSDGFKTIFPFWVQDNCTNRGYVELPYTLPQDHCLFVILQEKSIAIWKRKLDWIVKHGGMALMNTHPDYMHFGDKKMGIEEYPVAYYVEFLQYIISQYGDQYWSPLPREIARFSAIKMGNQGDRQSRCHN